MGTSTLNSIDMSRTDDGVVIDSSRQLDAGALFVLKSRGIFGLTLAALVTFYSYNLLSLVLEHHAQLGHRQLSSKGGMQLYQFVMLYGVLILVLVQVPSFHSLRYINLVSLVLCLAYSACATAGSVYIGSSKNAPKKDYSVKGSKQNQVFGAFNAISITATTYGNGILPEIQATVEPPVKGKMFKGLCLCYVVVVTTFFSVAISGYWAFGNSAQGTVLANFMIDEKPLLPTWVLLITNVFSL
ncbi:hypothetical protein CRYUN_Cryun09bG0077600 [Craigia yunnanensis]